MRFWNRDHELYEEYERLYDELVPMMGMTTTRAGEVLRAASRINYDHYNNGSCNNCTGAWYYLKDRGIDMMWRLGFDADAISMLNNALAVVWPYMNCDAPIVTFDETNLNEAMDVLAETATLVALEEERSGNFVPNTEDLLDLQDPNVYDDPYEDSWM